MDASNRLRKSQPNFVKRLHTTLGFAEGTKVCRDTEVLAPQALKDSSIIKQEGGFAHS